MAWMSVPLTATGLFNDPFSAQKREYDEDLHASFFLSNDVTGTGGSYSPESGSRGGNQPGKALWQTTRQRSMAGTNLWVLRLLRL